MIRLIGIIIRGAFVVLVFVPVCLIGVTANGELPLAAFRDFILLRGDYSSANP